jgi:hypothetical protein
MLGVSNSMKTLRRTDLKDLKGYLQDIDEKLAKPQKVLESVRAALDELGDLKRFVFLMGVEREHSRLQEAWFIFGIGRQGENAEEIFRIRYDESDNAAIRAVGFDETEGSSITKIDERLFTVFAEHRLKLALLLAEDRGAHATGVERFTPPNAVLSSL